jgi:uncharacterized membrane-anchored protein
MTTTPPASLFVRGLLFAALSVLAPLFSAAQEKPEGGPKSFVEALKGAGVKLVPGPATYKLGSVAEMKLPAGYHAVEAGSLKDYYELTQNVFDGDEAGVVIAPGPSEFVLVFEYDDIGYVKDEDKDSLDAKKLMDAMTEGEAESNKRRVKQGWDEIKIAGWANPPHYDQKTNNLTWAVRLTSSQDGHKEAFLNESIRLLGRSGVMNVTLVTGPDTYATDTATTADLLAKNYGYVQGERYAEFKEGDKIAEYGLAALVLGGAGAAAFKLGFFQKFWKVLVFGGVAAAAFFKKMLNKLTGRDPE